MLKRIKLGNRYFLFGLQKTNTVKGVTSICKDGKHVVLWDLDGINFKKDNLIQKMREIQDRYKLSNIYLFKSSPEHYHAYCLKKFDFVDMFDIIRMTPITDPTFLIWTAKRDRATLRVTPKSNKHRLNFLTCIDGKGEGEGSSAHKIFLSSFIRDSEKYFNYEPLEWDTNYEIAAVEYDTSEV